MVTKACSNLHFRAMAGKQQGSGSVELRLRIRTAAKHVLPGSDGQAGVHTAQQREGRRNGGEAQLNI